MLTLIIVGLSVLAALLLVRLLLTLLWVFFGRPAP